MVRAALTISAKLPYSVVKKGKWFISSCPILDVYSQGRTEKKAKENLVEALSLFFSSCYERNVLDEVLKECGFTAGTSTTRKPVSRVASKNIIDVPLYLFSNRNPAYKECPA
jgi:predicted RNase H-like HicB family nuclease